MPCCIICVKLVSAGFRQEDCCGRLVHREALKLIVPDKGADLGRVTTIQIQPASCSHKFE